MREFATAAVVAFTALAGCRSLRGHPPHDASVVGYSWIVDHDANGYLYRREGELYPTREQADHAPMTHLRSNPGDDPWARVVAVHGRADGEATRPEPQ